MIEHSFSIDFIEIEAFIVSFVKKHIIRCTLNEPVIESIPVLPTLYYSPSKHSGRLRIILNVVCIPSTNKRNKKFSEV